MVIEVSLKPFGYFSYLFKGHQPAVSRLLDGGLPLFQDNFVEGCRLLVIDNISSLILPLVRDTQIPGNSFVLWCLRMSLFNCHWVATNGQRLEHSGRAQACGAKLLRLWVKFPPGAGLLFFSFYPSVVSRGPWIERSLVDHLCKAKK